MTRGQYIVMCLLGALTVLSYLRGKRIEGMLQQIIPGGMSAPGSTKI